MTAPLIAQLAATLDEEGVTYCHWKSNLTLELAEQGMTDLDLLVDRSQFREFTQAMARCGFVAATRSHVKDPPGVEHLFAYDPSIGRFVHVHAHHQLILGHDRSKNYRLPIEKPYLESASIRGTLPVPEPEFEYVVLVVRMVLKYTLIDEVVWSALKGRRAGPSPSEREELDDLRARIDPVRVRTIVEDHLSFVSLDLFEASERLFEGASISERISVGRRMQTVLAPHARNPAWFDGGLRVWRRIALMTRRRAGRLHGFRLVSGGAVIAILGGDGAGKSTALDEISRWLSTEFDVSPVHLGKPKWSWTTYAVRAGLKAAHLLGILKDDDISVEDEPATDYRHLVWYACKSRDRYKQYRAANRAATRGTIILSDRFPHPALQKTDVPQIGRLSGERSSFALRRLSRLEEKYHSMVAPPDISFVLLLEPEEAARRKTDEPREYVLRRSKEIWETDWSSHDIHVIDASQSPQDVAAEMMRILWESLS